MKVSAEVANGAGESSTERSEFRHIAPESFDRALCSATMGEGLREMCADYHAWISRAGADDIISLFVDVRRSLEEMRHEFVSLLSRREALEQVDYPVAWKKIDRIGRSAHEATGLAQEMIEALDRGRHCFDPDGRGFDFAKMLLNESGIRPQSIQDLRDVFTATLLLHQNEPTATNEQRGLGIERINKLSLLLHNLVGASDETELTKA